MQLKKGTKVKFIWRGLDSPALKHGRAYKGVLLYYTGEWASVRTINCIAHNISSDDITAIDVRKKQKSVSASEYKMFGDLCFEMAVRFRDEWTSVISGKKCKPRDYAGIHGGHFISRSNWGTRHCLWNCHAITQGENYAMSRGDTKTITAYYNFLLDKYGPERVKTLYEMSEKPVKLSLDFLRSDCRKCFVWLNVHSGQKAKKEILDRISSWPKIRSDKIQRVMEDLDL